MKYTQMIKMTIFYFFAFLSIGLIAPLASAQIAPQPSIEAFKESATLAQIRQRGTIYVGHREDSVPFSYIAEGKAMGYSVDICDQVVAAIKIRLAMPNLNVVYVPLPASMRFTYLIDGIVDMECGVSSNSKIRQQRMAFSVPFFETSLKFLVAKNAGLDRIAQLDGKRVVLASAMASGQTVATAAKRRNINVRLVSAGGLPEALEMMAASKAEAMLGEDALLLGSLLITQHTDKFNLIDEAISTELYSITLRRDEPEFKQLVDDVLTGLIKRGELTTLYQKWFLDPIQPYGQRVGLPLSPRNQTLFAQ